MTQQLVPLTGEIVEGRTPEQWATVVRADLGQAVAGFIAAGQHLIEAKNDIPHGGWEAWVRVFYMSGPNLLARQIGGCGRR